jgi:hypothetical protein
MLTQWVTRQARYLAVAATAAAVFIGRAVLHSADGVSHKVEDAAHQIEDFVDEHGDEGKELLCYTAGHATQSAATGEVTLPTERDLEDEPPFPPPEKELLEDFLGVVQAADAQELVRADLAAGCGINSIADAG